MENLNILIVSFSPVIVRSTRLKGIPLAPLILKSYANNFLNELHPGIARIDTRTFFIDQTSPSEAASEILKENPDVVAFSVYIWSYHETMECIRIIKEKNESIQIICGGPQMSPVAEDMIAEHSYIDIIPYVTVPGEIIFCNIIKALIEEKELNSVEAIIFRDSSGGIIKTDALSEEFNYSDIASPYLDGSFSLPPGESYAVTLETSRGCPYDCGYCFYGRDTNKVYFYSLDRTFKEIEAVYSNPKIKHVFFSDADLFLKQSRAEEIINHILAQNSDVVSEFDINISRITERGAKLLSKLPNYRFCFAVQSVNPKALESIGKLRMDPEVFIEKINLVKQWIPEADFHVDVMLGLPEDDLSWFKKTLDVCLSLETTRIGLNYPLFLLPGTRFFDQRKSLGIKYTESHPMCLIETNSFPVRDIVTALRLFLWIEVFTYYYPAIGKYFYDTSRGCSESGVSRLETWIENIESKNSFSDSFSDVMETVSSGSVQKWGKLKGSFLEMLSDAENAYQIYDVIENLEKEKYNNFMERAIVPGKKVFDYMRSNGINTVGFSDLNSIPQEIVKDLTEDEVKNLFSRYR